MSSSLILASGSPRRQSFLKSLGLPFQVMRPVDEAGQELDESPLPDETPAELVQRLSRMKAQAVISSLDEEAQQRLYVVAADTEVALGDQVFGKPRHPEEAREMLQQLRQQPHQVYSGLTVAYSNHFITRLHQSTVWMRPYTDEEIETYIATGDPMDKAGAYGIQNKMFAPVGRLEGCFASVMGLPLGELATILESLGLTVPSVAQACLKATNHHSCCQKNLPQT